MSRLFCIGILFLGLSLCLPAAQADPASSVEGEIQEHYRAILGARDVLVKRLADQIAADATIAPARDVSLTLEGAIARGGGRSTIECTVHRRGDAWYGGAAEAKNYNLSRHEVDPSKLQLSDGRLTGRLTVTLNPDSWVPPDGRPRHLRIEVDGAIADGDITGTYRTEGDYDSCKGTLTGTVRGVTETAEVTRLGEDGLPAEPAEANRHRATLATRAYQQARGISMVLRQRTLLLQDALELTRLPSPDWSDGAAAADPIRSYLSTMRALLERRVTSEREAECIVGTVQVDDPFFGPYFNNEPLRVGEDGVAVVPEDVGRIDSQRWQMIPRWKLIAPLRPDSRWELNTPLLPEIIPAEGARYAPFADSGGKGEALQWQDHDPAIRFVVPPGQVFNPVRDKRGYSRGATGVAGLEQARWYGYAEVDSPRDVELYVSPFGRNSGKLWVNGELAWTSGGFAGEGVLDPPLARARLRKGRNCLLMACQSQKGPSYFWLMLSTGGGPLSTEQRARRREQQRGATVSLPADPRRGRRGNWSGRFPQADPPLGWDIGRGVNVKWRTPLPDYSAANPIIVGDRLLVNCEPHTLYCLDKETGRILWRREANVFDFAPDDKQAEAKKAWMEARAAEGSSERRELARELAALADEKRGLLEADNLSEAKEKQLDAAIADVEARKNALAGSNRLARYWQRELDVADHGWNNNYGYTFPAPCSDGEHIWVKYNTGVLACFDLSGERKWMVRTGMSGGVAQLPSPALVAGNVIIQGQLNDRRRQREWIGSKGAPPFYEHRMAAYDQASGELVWERPIEATGGYGGPGGFVPMRISDGNRTRELLVTHTGVLVDPADGKLLSNVRGAGVRGWYADPFVAENRVYLHRSSPVYAVEVWLEPDGRVGSKLVAQASRGGGNAGAAWWRGYVFGNNLHPSPQPIPWHDLNVADMRNGGTESGAIAPALRKGGLAYTPAASTRNYGVVTGTGCGSAAAWSIGGDPAQVGIFVPGPVPYFVGGGELDAPMVAQPVFEGDRMYARTYKSVLCLANEGADGERYSLRHKARIILESIPPEPETANIPTLSPLIEGTPDDGVPVEPCNTQTAPSRWLLAGPFPFAKDRDPLDALGGPEKALLKPGQEITQGDTVRTVTGLDGAFIEHTKGWQTDLYERKHYHAACAMDVLNAVDRAKNSVSYYYALVQTDQRRVVEVQLRGGKVATGWIDGREVRTGQQVRLEPGCHPILLRVKLDAYPSFIEKVTVSLRLINRPDPETAHPAWKGEIRKLRPRLLEVLSDVPGSAEARKARLILKAAGEKTSSE